MNTHKISTGLLTVISPIIFLFMCFTSVQGATLTSQANVRDLTGAYTFGSLRVIPIDTQYIRQDVFDLLDSLGADSVIKIFPGYDPADSLFTRPDGPVVRLVDLSKFYRIFFAGTVDWVDVQTRYPIRLRWD